MGTIPTLYLESSVISYLAAYPSRDLVVAAHQQITREWWDPEAAARRLDLVSGLSTLELTEDVRALGRRYHDKLGLPPGAVVDCIHLAYAVAYELKYLLTWNCVHLANGIVIDRLRKMNGAEGRETPIIVTPEELLELPEED